MKSLDVIFSGITAFAAVTAAIAAIVIGIRQTSIEELQNYAEIFVIPNNVSPADPSQVLVRNASSFPIYLSQFTLNGVTTSLGLSAIANDSNSWYSIPIPRQVQELGKFTLNVEFQDYGGRKYKSTAAGILSGNGWWNIQSQKRIPVSAN